MKQRTARKDNRKEFGRDKREFDKEKREYKPRTDRKLREERTFDRKPKTDNREYKSDSGEHKPKRAIDRFFKSEKPIMAEEQRTFRSRKHKSDKPKP